MNTHAGAFLEVAGRCLDAVSSARPFVADGLVPTSAEKIDYRSYGSRQTWQTPNRAASASVHAYESDDDKPTFSCMAQSKWDADEATANVIYDRVTAWANNEVAARRLAVGTYEYKIRPQDKTDIYNSVHGNGRGCEVKIAVRKIKFGSKYDLSVFFAMRTKPCTKSATSLGAGL